MNRAIVISIAGLLCSALLPLSAGADGRHRIEKRSNLPAQTLQPAGAAPAAQDAVVLSGLDFSAIAPPGIRMRVIENEPYSYVFGTSSALLQPGFSLTHLVIRADIPALDGIPLGYYEARISLSKAEDPGAAIGLIQSFDNAAHSAYRHAMLRQDDRGEVVYGIDEVRSPLGLISTGDTMHKGREYYAYSAVAINPNSEEGAVRRTPYQYIRGELRVMRRFGHAEGMLCIRMEAQEFPHALTMTENIARCLINRLVNPKKIDQRLGYLSYYPEMERAQLGVFDVLDPRTADLAERPGEGCGVQALPIQGDLCPECNGAGPFSPAQPYATAELLQDLAAELVEAICSHCLMGPEDGAPGSQDRRQSAQSDQLAAETAAETGCKHDARPSDKCSYVKRGPRK